MILVTFSFPHAQNEKIFATFAHRISSLTEREPDVFKRQELAHPNQCENKKADSSHSITRGVGIGGIQNH